MDSPQCYFMLSQRFHLFSPEGHLMLQSPRWGTLKVTSTVGREAQGQCSQPVVNGVFHD